jgi:hypothetical protein
MFLIGGLLALFHIAPVIVNDKPSYGVFPFLLLLTMSIPSGLAIAGINWVILNLGFKVQNLLKIPMRNHK